MSKSEVFVIGLGVGALVCPAVFIATQLIVGRSAIYPH